jgi:hypothetical protein
VVYDGSISKAMFDAKVFIEKNDLQNALLKVSVKSVRA